MNKISLIALGVAGLFLSGCSEEFLDRDPLGRPSTLSAFDTEVGATKMINATYDPLVSVDAYSGAYFIFADVMGGDSETGGADASDKPDFHSLMQYIIAPNNAGVSAFFKNAYTGISRCNIAIDKLEDPKNSLEANAKSKILGQAYFMRAFYYFDLVRLYGPVPLTKEPWTLENNKKITNRQEGDADGSLHVKVLYEQIFADFQKAADMLPESWPGSEKGRATKGAANAYLAKAHLTLASIVTYNQSLYPNLNANATEHWQAAYDYSEKVIASGVYSLLPSYQSLFTVENENSKESIFEAQCINASDYGVKDEGSYRVPLQSPRNYVGLAGAQGWGFNCPTEAYVKSFEHTSDANGKLITWDPRLDMVAKGSNVVSSTVIPDFAYVTGKPVDGIIKGKVMFVDTEKSPTGYYGRKQEMSYNADDKVNGWGGKIEAQGLNWIIYRYADVLLIQAEAAAHLGNNSKAVARVNEVRTRARNSTRVVTLENGEYVTRPAQQSEITFPTLLDGSTSGKNLISAIWDERRHELGLECQLFFDLVRTGRLASTYEKIQTVSYNRPVYFVKGKSERLPLPIDAIIDGEGRVKQNVGY